MFPLRWGVSHSNPIPCATGAWARPAPRDGDPMRPTLKSSQPARARARARARASQQRPKAWRPGLCSMSHRIRSWAHSLGRLGRRSGALGGGRLRPRRRPLAAEGHSVRPGVRGVALTPRGAPWRRRRGQSSGAAQQRRSQTAPRARRRRARGLHARACGGAQSALSTLSRAVHGWWCHVQRRAT